MSKGKLVKKTSILLLVVVISLSLSMLLQARQVGQFLNRTFSGDVTTKTLLSSSSLTKDNYSDAVLNYSTSTKTGSASAIIPTMINSNGVSRGSGSATQVGEREVFSTTGEPGYYYDLEATKAYSGSSMKASGTWSPDEY